MQLDDVPYVLLLIAAACLLAGLVCKPHTQAAQQSVIAINCNLFFPPTTEALGRKHAIADAHT